MILSIIGDIGSGKTLSGVKYCYDQYKKGFTIFTNIRLVFPKIKGCGKVVKLDGQFFKDYTASKFNLINAVVFIDEAHVFFDSRNAMMKRNKIFSKFVTQSRKRSVDVLLTTQDKTPQLFLSSGQVELRARKLTDYIIFCQTYKKGKNTYIIQTVCDRYGLAVKKKIFPANPYFSLYDTMEIIDFDDID